MGETPLPQTGATAVQVTQERRSVPRASGQFVVRYQRYTDSTWRVSSLRDLSERGGRFVCDEALEAGDFVRLLVRLPQAKEPVRLPAQIVWRRAAFSGTLRMHEVGLRFLHVEPPAWEVLEASVEHLLHHR